jgi:hypothetical protein
MRERTASFPAATGAASIRALVAWNDPAYSGYERLGST